MKIIYLFLVFVSFSSFANLDKIKIQNLDLDYALPVGAGTVEKVGIGLGIAPQLHEVMVYRTEAGFDLQSSLLDFSWMEPPTLIYNLQALSVSGMNLSAGEKKHSLVAKKIQARLDEKEDFKAYEISLDCFGDAQGKLNQRLLLDCRNQMEFKIKKFDVPIDFLFYKLTEDLPASEEIDIPAENVVLKINQGDLYLQVYLKFWIKAGLRFWGHLQFEDDFQTLALRVDEVKFGYVPVTGLVMKKLKELIKHPDVEVNPPWIKMKLGRPPCPQN